MNLPNNILENNTRVRTLWLTYSSRCIEFKNLRVLNTWGGCLQRNFLRRFGAQLIQLKLVHVEQLTLHGSIMEIFKSCPALESLELQNCSIQDPNNHHDQQHLQWNHSTDVKLKQLIIVSKCSEAFINRLLKWIPGHNALIPCPAVVLNFQIE